MQNLLMRIKKRRNLILFCLWVCFLALVVRSAFLTIGSANRMQSSLAVMNRSPQSFIALGTQVEKLDKITANIDNYKIGEIKDALIDTAILARNANKEFQAQYESWLFVRGAIDKDKNSFLQLRKKLDEVQKLQDGEIVHLKELLDESNKPSLASEIFNFSSAFVLGVFSSIIATMIYEKYKTGKKL